MYFDLVGPLPTCQGFTYLLTMVDHFSHWPEVVPVTDFSAASVGKALVARFLITGEPMGTTRTRTTAYHPATDGMVERMHRTLQMAFRAQSNPQNCVDYLPLFLLGMRAAIKEDLGFSAKSAPNLRGRTPITPKHSFATHA